MSKPSATNLSLASLFTLTTAVAVVIWVVMYAPILLCFLVIVALPAMLRLGEYLQTAKRIKQTLTLTEILVGYAGASILCTLALLSLSAALTGLIYIAAYLPPELEMQPLAFFITLNVILPVLGCCCYFLLGEVWKFPVRFANAFGRLPNYREQIGQVLKAISLNLFVFGWCAALLLWTNGAVENTPNAVVLGLMIPAQAATAVAAYLFVRYFFERVWLRGIAGFVLAAVFFNGVYRYSTDPSDTVKAAPGVLIAGLLIALPFFRWPATPVAPEPLTPEMIQSPKPPAGTSED